jgi:hypothetical protein
MARARVTAGLIAASAVLVGSVPAAAQFNPFEALFGSPPRPPSSVPSGRQPPQAYPQYPEQADPRSQDPRYQDPRYQDPRYRDPRNPEYPEQAGVPPRPAPPGGIQSQPLPPPPGGTTAAVPPGQPLPGVAPGQRPRGTPQPADTAPQPDDEVITELPSQKIPNKGALFSGLDKITGRIINFDVAIGETVQFGALQVTPRVCYTRPPTETSNTDAFIEVAEVTLQGEVKRIFTGWMFASSPGLHAVEHPIYDVWLTDCKNPVVAAAPPPEAAPAPAAQPAKPPAQRRPAQQQPAPQGPRR